MNAVAARRLEAAKNEDACLARGPDKPERVADPIVVGNGDGFDIVGAAGLDHCGVVICFACVDALLAMAALVGERIDL